MLPVLVGRNGVYLCYRFRRDGCSTLTDALFKLGEFWDTSDNRGTHEICMLCCSCPQKCKY